MRRHTANFAVLKLAVLFYLRQVTAWEAWGQ
jgi:hypothetical protein